MAELIQGLWVGAELSLMEQLSITSFIKNGHRFHLYVYEDMKDVPRGATMIDGNSILPKEEIFELRHGSHTGSLTPFSNLFRFKLLLEKGGWWVDLDVVCLKPFDFGSSPYIITSEYDEPSGVIGPSSAVLKVPKGDDFIKACFKKVRSLCTHLEVLHFGDTGYKLVREMVKRYNLEAFVKPPATFAPLGYWQYRTFIEPQDLVPDLSNSYAIHLYNEMWRRERLDKNNTYSQKSLYGALIEKFL